MPNDERLEISITGTVQGVGFRPFVYNLAVRFGLAGYVMNCPRGVLIEAQGPRDSLERFLEALKAEAPPHVRIDSLSYRTIPVREPGEFAILPSSQKGTALAVVPPDLATCQDCLEEVFGPENRRYMYPFTNCTRCGPRFTIVKVLPYDRPSTTMAGFPLCSKCSSEYHNPMDRRFHAQPVACPDCGPSVTLLIPDRRTDRLVPRSSPDPLREARDAIAAGKIVAIKGLGGFHVTCDATSSEAVNRVRMAKRRLAKPFAIMCRDIEQVREICEVSAQDEAFLTSDARPIVILRRKGDNPGGISDLVAPGQDTLGVMLPYTPLHHILMRDMPHPLVMTSANPGEEPIAIDEGELDRVIIRGLDLVVTHNRGIHSRCDDSVLIGSPLPIIIRRSRGYVPAPVRVPLARESLGVGGDSKNTACFIREGLAYLTQHVGALEGERSLQALGRAIDHFRELFGFEPEIVGCDMHPGYISRETGFSLGIPVVEVQHHHAHIASCMAENLISGKVMGVAFDGTGYGPDRTVWGGEFLLADYSTYVRAASLRPVAMPGGEWAVREPWRMAVSYLFDSFGEDLPDFPGSDAIYTRGASLIIPAIGKGLNSPLTSSCGRLFDAVAAMLGISFECSFEGQAAMALESLAWKSAARPAPYGYEILENHGMMTLDLRPALRAIVADLLAGREKPQVALGFHLTVASGILGICRELRERTGITRVALSGGVFQNRILLLETLRSLRGSGFSVIYHRDIPPNDGGISLGQAAVASAQPG